MDWVAGAPAVKATPSKVEISDDGSLGDKIAAQGDKV